MTIRDLHALGPVGRAELLRRAAQTDLDGRLWRAALGEEATGAATSRTEDQSIARLNLEALVQEVLRSEPRTDTVAPAAMVPAEQGTSSLNLGANAGFARFIEAAAERTGVPPAALAAIVDAEAAKLPSGQWNPQSRNPRSSAAGLGQFLSGTWIEQAQRPGTWLHGQADARGWLEPSGRLRPECRSELLGLRYDATASIEATADYARSNLAALRRSTVVGSSDTEVARAAYLAHHLGLGDARTFLAGGLTDERARRLLGAQVGASSAAHRIAQAGDASVAHRQWLSAYVGKRIQPARFLA